MEESLVTEEGNQLPPASPPAPQPAPLARPNPNLVLRAANAKINDARGEFEEIECYKSKIY